MSVHLQIWPQYSQERARQTLFICFFKSYLLIPRFRDATKQDPYMYARHMSAHLLTTAAAELLCGTSLSHPSQKSVID